MSPPFLAGWGRVCVFRPVFVGGAVQQSGSLPRRAQIAELKSRSESAAQHSRKAWSPVLVRKAGVLSPGSPWPEAGHTGAAFCLEDEDAVSGAYVELGKGTRRMVSDG